ncbi:MAG: phosphatase PAP2 family protein [Deltaproteobacteria bacterium]|nr:phosphatase PAP2 family protein [Deltaproteobacteria bacterium]
MVRRVVLVLMILGWMAPSATAEPWYRGKYGRNRVTHLTITVGVGTAWLATTLLKGSLVSDCRWCEPPGFDRATRDALVWNNTGRAGTLSSLNVYVVSPIAAFGLLVLSDHDASASRLIDDLLPIAETVVFTQLAVHLLKLGVKRQRPEVRFGTATGAPTASDNLSFPSGHSSLGFALTTSAGLVAHWRHYWTEPYIWGVGITLSLATEYLRVAADKHYLSDVLAGGLVGVGAGLLVPRLMRRELKIVPVANGAALAGQF